MQQAIADALKQAGATAKKGTVWSTDAVFRETPSKVLRFRKRGAVAVEMEASALFSVGRFRKVKVGALLVVSDDLSEATWRHGFRDPEFAEGRQTLCKGIAALCRTTQIP
jgi:purine-nucleoside phosphorylase